MGKENILNYVIIIEGPDNIGKSEFVKKIKKKHLSAIQIHYGPNKTKQQGKQVMFDMIQTLTSLEYEKNKVVIMDRSPFGEFVYGKKFRKYDPFTYWGLMVDKLNGLKKTKFLFVCLYADSNTYDQFSISPKEDEDVKYKKSYMAEEVSVAFIQLLNKLCVIDNMSRVVVNSNNYKTLNDRNAYILDIVQSFLQHKVYIVKPNKYDSTIFNPYQNIVGEYIESLYQSNCKCKMYREECSIGKEHYHSIFGKGYDRPIDGCGTINSPRYIFVGEAPGQNGCGTYGIPFYGDPSGNLFYNALFALNILHSEIYTTNIIRCCPKDNNLGKYYDIKERLKLECVRTFDTSIPIGDVIALGRIASNTLKALKIEHKFVYHPAYYLRSGQQEGFIEDLEKVL